RRPTQSSRRVRQVSLAVDGVKPPRKAFVKDGDRILNHDSLRAVDDTMRFRVINFEFKGKVSLSWYLSKKEEATITRFAGFPIQLALDTITEWWQRPLASGQLAPPNVPLEPSSDQQ